ncbi:hypothetical protein [Priestia koreensis]|uniref:hypothetical protein n=1 Tax=Priestia koreensis TaxID=284581 RepID=UPI0034599A16
MKGKWLLLILLVVPWLTLVKMDRQTFKRYLPVLTFSSLVIALISELSHKFTWWKVKTPLFPSLASDISFLFGPFFVINLWIFKFTFGRFWLYLSSNIVLDYLFAYPLTSLAEKLKVYRMVNMTRLQLFLLSVGTSVLNYGYQWFLNDMIRSKSPK